MGIAVRAGTHCAEPLVKTFSPHGTVRASVAMYNTPEEIDSLLSGLERVASVLSV
jgi:cysteine desulfurase/selenocysteine lyase